MPKTDTSTQADILRAGREEFLERGFRDASLRRIAAAAGVTTGAIYGYYPDKEALFAALVEPAAGAFKERFLRAQHDFTRLPQDAQVGRMSSYSSGELQALLDHVYAHFDAFRLVVCRSAGTAYEDYVEELVEVEAAATTAFMEVLRRNGNAVQDLRPNLVHILSNAYFSAIFETVAHGMDKAEADDYVEHITAFFTAGWTLLLGL